MRGPKENPTMDCYQDPETPPMLLPTFLVARDNARQMRHYKTALRQGFRLCLTPVQQEQLRLFYGEGMRKSEIARRQGCTCSGVSKSIRVAQDALRGYITLYMGIFTALERELLRDTL